MLTFSKTKIIIGVTIVILLVAGGFLVMASHKSKDLSQEGKNQKSLEAADKITEIAAGNEEELMTFSAKENEQETIVTSDRSVIDQFKYIFDDQPKKQQ